jgi:hypothetical protein
VLATAAVLAVVVLARAVPEARSVFAEPVTIKVGTFAVGRLLLPVVVILTGSLALIIQTPTALEVGVVFSVTLAVISM